MTQKKKPNRYSISRILREQKKSNDFLELMIGNLTLEELIALKLEVAFRSVPTPVYGIPVWKATPKLARDAVLKFALSVSGSKLMAARLLGMNNREFANYINKYEILDYYKKEKGDDYRNTIKTDIPKSTS
jgi:hypothetical protein